MDVAVDLLNLRPTTIAHLRMEGLIVVSIGTAPSTLEGAENRGGILNWWEGIASMIDTSFVSALSCIR
jgi:hypothetical protein